MSRCRGCNKWIEWPAKFVTRTYGEYRNGKLSGYHLYWHPECATTESLEAEGETVRTVVKGVQ